MEEKMEHRHEEHERECECGCREEHEHHAHDHEHHGHHDYDHDHDHDHDHHHDHHHDHDHDHHHDHDHDHHHHDHGPVHISHHESSIIGAMKGNIPTADYDEAEKMLVEQMREAGRRVTEAGGIIGHIKFIITEPGRCGQISVTDVDENIRHFEGKSCSIEGVAIVFAVDDDTLKNILTETIGSILEKDN